MIKIREAVSLVPSNIHPLIDLDKNINTNLPPDWASIVATSKYREASWEDRDRVMTAWLSQELKGQSDMIDDAATEDVLKQKSINALVKVAQNYDREMSHLIDSTAPVPPSVIPSVTYQSDNTSAIQSQLQRLSEQNEALSKKLDDQARKEQVNQVMADEPKSIFHDQTILYPGGSSRNQTVIDEGSY